MKKFLSIAIITIACILGIASCAGTAGGDIGDGATAKLYFGSSRAAISFADLSDVVLKGSYEGGSEKVLMKWASGASMNGTEIEIKAGNWNFTLEATCKYQVSKATASKKLEPDTTNSVSFDISHGGTGVYKVPESALSDNSWFNTSSGVAKITVSGVTDANFNNLAQVINYIDGRYRATQVELVIQGSVTSITASAFTSVTNLSRVTLPNTVTTLSSSCFSGCTNLTSINIENVTTIANSAFSGCTSLTSVTLNNSITVINSSVFNGCSSLANINLPSALTTIGTTAFSRTGLTTISLPPSLNRIEANAFLGCNLTSVSNFTNGIGWTTEDNTPVQQKMNAARNTSDADFFKRSQYFTIIKS